MKRTVRILALVTSAGLAAACGGADELLDAVEGVGGDGTFTSLYAGHFQRCKACHADGALGFNPDKTERTLDFTTQESAYTSLHGTASGLTGNQAPCNGVRFLGATAGESLIVAVMDEDVRAAYDNPAAPDCNADTITDVNVLTGVSAPAGWLADLKAWIDAGAPND